MHFSKLVPSLTVEEAERGDGSWGVTPIGGAGSKVGAGEAASLGVEKVTGPSGGFSRPRRFQSAPKTGGPGGEKSRREISAALGAAANAKNEKMRRKRLRRSCKDVIRNTSQPASLSFRCATAARCLRTRLKGEGRELLKEGPISRTGERQAFMTARETDDSMSGKRSSTRLAESEERKVEPMATRGTGKLPSARLERASRNWEKRAGKRD